MAVSRAPRSPQKAMAVLLGLALVFSLLLMAVSRESDLHVVHDRTGGHFEHDHHRVFDSHGGVSSLRGGAFGGERARAHGPRRAPLRRSHEHARQQARAPVRLSDARSLLKRTRRRVLSVGQKIVSNRETSSKRVLE